MTRNQVLGGFGSAALALGVAFILVGRFAGEVGQMLAGYGWLMVITSAYLLLGLTVRRMLQRRRRPSPSVGSPVAASRHPAAHPTGR